MFSGYEIGAFVLVLALLRLALPLAVMFGAGTWLKRLHIG